LNKIFFVIEFGGSMNWKKFVTFGVLALLLVSTFGAVAAQTGVNPSVSLTPTKTETEEGGSRFFTHPVVALLGAYFGRESAPKLETTATPVATATVTTTPEPGETVTPTSVGEVGEAETSEEIVDEEIDTYEGETSKELVGEEIARYHEAGMGFGVLVKIYAMAEASVVACVKANTLATTTPVASSTAIVPADCPSTVIVLVNAFKSGTGMGQLFKLYGKPALLGVGHVRKELAKQTATPVASGTTQPTVQENDQANVQQNSMHQGKPVRVLKIKPNHAKGPNR
jgi:hypothetical protein